MVIDRWCVFNCTVQVQRHGAFQIVNELCTTDDCLLLSISGMYNVHFIAFQLVIIRQRDKLEPVFLQYLMEDRGSGGTSSYVDFLCHIHKEIRNLLS